MCRISLCSDMFAVIDSEAVYKEGCYDKYLTEPHMSIKTHTTTSYSQKHRTVQKGFENDEKHWKNANL